MTTREFIRQRGRIQRNFPNESKRNIAMRHLVAEAGAQYVFIDGKLTGWRMPNGETVCAKRRHKDQAAAEAELQRIKAITVDAHRIPTRTYQCAYCQGWHLTSQPAHFDKAA